MFHYDNDRDDMISYNAYFYIPVLTDGLYYTKKEKTFEHDYPENFKFCPETGKELWHVVKKNMEILTSDNNIIDPHTNEVLANFFERLELLSTGVTSFIGYKIEFGKEFDIPFNKIEKLLDLLKQCKIINKDIGLKDFKINVVKENLGIFDVLRRLPRQQHPEKKWMAGDGAISSGSLISDNRT